MPKNVAWFKHDNNASDDPKIKAMRKQYGWEGLGWYWHIIELMRVEEGYKLEYSPLVLSALADDFRCDIPKVEKYLTDCMESYQLFCKNTTHFYSARLCRDMVAVESNLEQRKLAGKLSAQKRLGVDSQLPLNDRLTTVERPLNDRSSSVQQIRQDKKDKIRKEIEDDVKTSSTQDTDSFKGKERGELVRETFKLLDGARGYRPTVKRKPEAAAIIRMLKTYTPTQIIETWQKMKRDVFWAKQELFMMSVESQIGAMLNGEHKNNSEEPNPSEDTVAKYTGGKYGHMVIR